MQACMRNILRARRCGGWSGPCWADTSPGSGRSSTNGQCKDADLPRVMRLLVYFERARDDLAPRLVLRFHMHVARMNGKGSRSRSRCTVPALADGYSFGSDK
jgi:hypothetical protein